MLHKTKTLKEIIKPKANKLGISFEEMLEDISEEKRYEYLEKQLNKYVSRKGLRADTKLSRLFLKSEFLKKCSSDFHISKPNNYLKKYKSIVFKAFDNYMYNDREWKSMRFICSSAVEELEKEERIKELESKYKKGLGGVPPQSGYEKVFNLSKEFKYPFVTYYIDENERTKIYELAKRILGKGNPRSYDLHFCEYYSYLKIIDRLFHCVRIDASHRYNTVWESGSYKEVSNYVEFDDLSENTKKYIKLFDKRRKEDPKIPSDYAYNFGPGEWQNTRVYDLKITNVMELEVALDEYRKIVTKMCIKKSK